MAAFSEYRARLANCGIGSGDVLFVHAGMSWLTNGIGDAKAVIDALFDLVGTDGTICMPSYTWRFPDAMGPAQDTVVDLRNTPAAVGILAELFRRSPGVRRSVNYWAPICAWGARAGEIADRQATIIDPFGPGSSFRLAMECGAKVVGIGVALGAASLSHLPDYSLAPYYPYEIYAPDLLVGDVVDFDGDRHRVRSVTVTSAHFAAYTPSATFARSERLRSSLIFEKWGAAFVWVIPSPLYHDEALEIGRESLSRGELPPWIGGARWLPAGATG